MEYHSAHQLHVEMSLSQSALGSLAHGGKSFRQQVVLTFAVFMTLAEFIRLGRQLIVGERLELRFQRVDHGHRLS